MKKIPDIINRLWNVCGQMEVGALLTCGSGIKYCNFTNFRCSFIFGIFSGQWFYRNKKDK